MTDLLYGLFCAILRHRANEQCASSQQPPRIIKPDMVLTIGSGIYVHPAKNEPKEFWNIGIRIEDDALVTAKGCELMTRSVPVKADEIEALMRE